MYNNYALLIMTSFFYLVFTNSMTSLSPLAQSNKCITFFFLQAGLSLWICNGFGDYRLSTTYTEMVSHYLAGCKSV